MGRKGDIGCAVDTPVRFPQNWGLGGPKPCELGKPMSNQYVIGVDVGTGSVRAALFDIAGHRLALATEPIALWRPHPEWAEQSSVDIWNAVGKTVRQVVADAAVDPADVAGIGFDATCSLVVLDKGDRPLPVSPNSSPSRFGRGAEERGGVGSSSPSLDRGGGQGEGLIPNIIVWMDHRAVDQAERINAGKHDVLRYVGGGVSPEMETPKLLWLKENLPSTWAAAGKFLDLADFLVYQSTGNDIRSLCTVVCKWTYLGHEKRWDKDFLNDIGLGDIFDGRVGEDVRDVGERAGHLTESAAAHLGLTTSTAVGVGIIDAHAGGVGLLGAAESQQSSNSSPSRFGRGGEERTGVGHALALIGGTSSCHMAVSKDPRFIDRIWGPYFGAMIPGLWLTEGGQSATGALIDYALANHAAAPALVAEAAQKGVTVYEIVNEHIDRMAASLAPLSLEGRGAGGEGYLTRDIHILDYHLGNRSPIADPRAHGMVDGLTLDTSRDSLALLYLASIQAVAYGTKAIVDAMNAGGYNIREIHVVGGGTRNPLWLQEHADVLGMPLHLSEEPESVLLGSAILGATASDLYPDVPAAMRAMSRRGSTVEPNPSMRAYHDAKYACYREMYAQQIERRRRMASV